MTRLLLKSKIFFRLFLNRKISFVKVLNYVSNFFHKILRTSKSGKAPSFLVMETSNRCNMFCVTCRDKGGRELKLVNFDGKKIRKGEMDMGIFSKAVDQTKRYLLLLTLYVGGEPLLNKNIYEMINYANKRKVPTLISTNGMLLDEKNSSKLKDNCLDILKIAISGMTQEIYSKFHRGGDINKVLENIKKAARNKGKTLIILDYLAFEHNKHEIEMARKFAKRLGIEFNLRKGRTLKGTFLKSIRGMELKPNDKVCDWPWMISLVHWDGKIYPCCEWSGYDYEKHLGRDGDVMRSWNSKSYQKLRKDISNRKNISPWCMNCHYKGIDFQ